MLMMCSQKPSLSSRLADRLILSKIRHAIGLDEAELCVSAAAPISRSTLDFLVSLNMPMAEVYGMSETSGKRSDKHICFTSATDITRS